MKTDQLIDAAVNIGRGGVKILQKGLKVENWGHRTQYETSFESGVESYGESYVKT